MAVRSAAQKRAQLKAARASAAKRRKGAKHTKRVARTKRRTIARNAPKAKGRGSYAKNVRKNFRAGGGRAAAQFLTVSPLAYSISNRRGKKKSKRKKR